MVHRNRLDAKPARGYPASAPVAPHQSSIFQKMVDEGKTSKAPLTEALANVLR
jgi:hypothetical protein